LRLLHSLVCSSFYVTLYEVTLDIFKTPDRLTITDSTDVNIHLFGILFSTFLRILQLFSKECFTKLLCSLHSGTLTNFPSTIGAICPNSNLNPSLIFDLKVYVTYKNSSNFPNIHILGKQTLAPSSYGNVAKT